MPTFGAFGTGPEIGRDDNHIPEWALVSMLDSALKKGKGQQDILTGAVFKGACEHIAMKAGGNEACQLLVAEKGAVTVTSSEKYLITHSAHTSVKFIAAAWDLLKAYPVPPSSHRSTSDTSRAGWEDR